MPSGESAGLGTKMARSGNRGVYGYQKYISSPETALRSGRGGFGARFVDYDV